MRYNSLRFGRRAAGPRPLSSAFPLFRTTTRFSGCPNVWNIFHGPEGPLPLVSGTCCCPGTGLSSACLQPAGTPATGTVTAIGPFAPGHRKATVDRVLGGCFAACFSVEALGVAVP